MSARFSFTGALVINTDSESKNYFLRTGKTAKGAEYKSVNFQVAAEKNNRAFVELFGMVGDIRTLDTDGNSIEISWSDRNDASVVKTVASYKKIVISVDGSRHEFVAPYDAIQFIENNTALFKDKKFTVTGQRNKNIYEGTVSDRFQIAGIYEVPEETKNKLSSTMEFFFDKDSFDTTEWSDSKKIYINGYTNEWIDKDIKNKYLSQQLVFDASRLNLADEKHISLLKIRLKLLGLSLSENKVKVDIKAGKVYKLSVITSYQNGAEEVPFDESMLTPTQKELLALGIKELDDFRPNGSVYGDRVTIYKVTDFNIKGDYADGMIDTEMKPSEFEEEIYTPAKKESAKDVLDAVTQEAEDELDDLFG